MPRADADRAAREVRRRAHKNVMPLEISSDATIGPCAKRFGKRPAANSATASATVDTRARDSRLRERRRIARQRGQHRLHVVERGERRETRQKQRKIREPIARGVYSRGSTSPPTASTPGLRNTRAPGSASSAASMRSNGMSRRRSRSRKRSRRSLRARARSSPIRSARTISAQRATDASSAGSRRAGRRAARGGRCVVARLRVGRIDRVRQADAAQFGVQFGARHAQERPHEIDPLRERAARRHAGESVEAAAAKERSSTVSV